MKHIFGAIKNRYVRNSTQLGLNRAATLPASGFTPVDNSTGASRAAAELSAELGAALDQINFEDNPRTQLTTELELLDSRVAEYANSSLSFCSSAEPWECTRREAEIIGAAFDCAAKAYDGDLAERAERVGCKLDFSLPSSAGGSIRATKCSIYAPQQQPESGSIPTLYLIIAVRGAANKVEHIVNFHNEPRNAKTLFESTENDDALQSQRASLYAHAGFLNSAMKLIGPLSTQIENRLRQNPRQNILFTGHSAGGAVAALLHLSFRVKLGATFTDATFSCITFGSPPVARTMSEPEQKALNHLLAKGYVLNIVNEYDLVARADRGYVHSLVELYRSSGPSETVHPPNQNEVETSDDNRSCWPLPKSEFQHVGPKVILKITSPALNTESSTSTPPGLALSAWRITEEDFSRLVFCRLTVHGKLPYRERIDQIENGCFNGRTRWPSESEGDVN